MAASDALTRISMAKSETQIDLSGLNLVQVPEEAFTKAGEWEKVDLGFNKFVQFPNVSAWKFLLILDLNGNMINTLQPFFDVLPPTLLELYLNGNQITEIPDSIERMPKLEKLFMANNRIRKISPNIGKLKKLTDLMVNGNPLIEIPKMVGACTLLEVVDFSDCGLTEVPGEITYCKKMLEINLSSNKLTSLPVAMGRMARLTSLNLAGNQLSDLPDSLGLCPALATFGGGVNISQNPITDKTLIQKWNIGPDQLWDYLRHRNALHGDKPLPDYDKVLLGLETVNLKTTNLKPTLKQTEPAKPTGPSIDQKLIALKRWGNTTIQTELRSNLRDLQNALAMANEPAPLVKLGQKVKLFQSEVEKTKKIIAAYPVPQSKVSQGTKVQLLKGVMEASLTELGLVLRNLQQSLNDCETETEIVPIIQAIKGLKGAADQGKKL